VSQADFRHHHEVDALFETSPYEAAKYTTTLGLAQVEALLAGKLRGRNSAGF
jgi:hypothetical protein